MPWAGRSSQHESCEAPRPSRGRHSLKRANQHVQQDSGGRVWAHHVSTSAHLAAHDDCARHRRASQAKRRSGMRPAPPAGAHARHRMHHGPSAQLCVQVCSAARMPGSCAARARAQGRLASARGRTLGRHVRQRAIRVCVHPAAVAHEPRQPCTGRARRQRHTGGPLCQGQSGSRSGSRRGCCRPKRGPHQSRRPSRRSRARCAARWSAARCRP